MSKILVVGAGAAGAIAAVFAAKKGNEVHVFEKNEKTGKKIYITGKGRCNLTNAVDNEELMKNVVSNPKFLYSSFSAFSSEDTIAFFESLGCKTKVERGRRVFPVSDRSSDVIKALDKGMKEAGVSVHYKAEVKEVLYREETKTFRGIRLSSGEEIFADSLIIATGGLSYRSTGSTGDGYKFAKSLGHKVTELRPALVSMNVEGDFFKELQGLTLKNIRLTVKRGKKTAFSELGELLFTRTGISGPLVLSAGSIAGDIFAKGRGIVSIDLKPGLSPEELEARVLRDFEEVKAKQVKNSLDKLLPKSLIPVFLQRTGLDLEKRTGSLSKAERMKIIEHLKKFELTVIGLRGYEEAVITKGGVSVKEVNPNTMESKLIRGLYFAGEVLDLDALTGGYNLQIAWSTGVAAGKAAGDRE